MLISKYMNLFLTSYFLHHYLGTGAPLLLKIWSGGAAPFEDMERGRRSNFKLGAGAGELLHLKGACLECYLL